MTWDRDDTFLKGYRGNDESGWPIGQKVTSEQDGAKERLHVDARITGGTIGAIPTIDKRLTYNDMNVANGGVARDASITNNWTRVYNYIGQGLIFGFLATLESITESGWRIRLVVDDNEIFGVNGFLLADFNNDQIYNFKENNNFNDEKMGIHHIDKNTFNWESPSDFPMVFDLNISVFVIKSGNSKKFRAGLITLVKV